VSIPFRVSHTSTSGSPAPTALTPRCWLIEPTESESKEELDRFIDALISIRKEVDEIVEGSQPKDNNVFKNAPHPLSVLLEDNWDKSYSRSKAVWPVASLKKTKFWPTVGRLDDGEFFPLPEFAGADSSRG